LSEEIGAHPLVGALIFGILSFKDEDYSIMVETIMKVNFYATLRPIVGQKTVELRLPEGTTAIQLVLMFVKDYPAMHGELLDKNEQFLPHMKFFINGREALYLPDKMDTIIQPEDKVDIFPPVGGG
jgi:molybdopterin synthase sulfur carrier subunit